MNTNEITPETLAGSVISVPPLARNADFSLNREENEKLVRHLEAGGVSTLLYGGNAIMYHVAISEFAELLGMLSDIAAEDSLVIPSVGPNFGTMLDQAAILADMDFPTAMILPTRDVVTSAGVAAGVKQFVDAFGKPAVLYVKHDGYVDVATVKSLMNDGLLSWIKYAVVRDDTSNDPWLRELIDEIGPSRIVSGIGEQPAVCHLNDFGLISFTSGCVCVAPKLSMDLLAALKTGNIEEAERIRTIFEALEDQRNSINPIRVLHNGVGLAGIADMGPLIPLLSELDLDQLGPIQAAATELLGAEQAAVVG